MKVYRGSDGDVKPVEMDCDEYGFPNKTKCGELMYDNTHFKTQREAWDSIKSSANAQVLLAGANVKQAEKHLKMALERAGVAAVRFETVDKNFLQWRVLENNHQEGI